MSNQLKMADIQAILWLRAQGSSFREIARQLGVHRETAARYVHQALAASEPASALTGSSGSSSQCANWREVILAKLEAGLSARRIWQDLQTELGCSVSYYSVCRFVRKLSQSTTLPMRPMECLPGEEAQIDFGTGAPIIAPDLKRRKTHVLRTCSRTPARLIARPAGDRRPRSSFVCWRMPPALRWLTQDTGD